MSIYKLYSDRLAEERDGLPDVLEYDKFPEKLKVQIVHIWGDTWGGLEDVWNRRDFSREIFQYIVRLLRKEIGVFALIESAKSVEDELVNYFLRENSVERSLDVVEVVLSTKVLGYVLRMGMDHEMNNFVKQRCAEAVGEINGRFMSHGVGYQLEQGRIIRVDSKYAHSGIVRPALLLLRESGFETANKEFLDAHERYRKGDFSGSLVDCAKAFESTMKVICDVRGWRYDAGRATAKRLVATCLEKGLLPRFSEQQLMNVANVLESGVATARNKLGGHGQGSTPVAIPQHFALFGLHSTATNIILLVEAHKALPR